MAQSYTSPGAFPPYQADSPPLRSTPPPLQTNQLSPTSRKVPHSQDTIRENTVQLSNMLMVASPTLISSPHSSVEVGPLFHPHQRPGTSFVFPQSPSIETESVGPTEDDKASTLSSLSASSADASRSSGDEAQDTRPHPSGLSILLRSQEPSPERPVLTPTPTSPTAVASRAESQFGDGTITGGMTPQATPRPTQARRLSGPVSPNLLGHYGRNSGNSAQPAPLDVSERTPLLFSNSVKPDGVPNGTNPSWSLSRLSLEHVKRQITSLVPKIPLTPESIQQTARDTLQAAVKAIPAVILGCLLNILDGLSFLYISLDGMIAFPASTPFIPDETSLTGFDGASVGVSMFFITTVVSQLVYTLGGSQFAGGNGSMMIEVVPFFHIIGMSIAKDVGYDTEDEQRTVIATTMAAFILSSLLTGITFFLLGALKLGTVIGFFPRHILVGCIGGVGLFLIETGLAVSLRISDDDFAYNWTTFKLFFFDSHNFALWSIPFALAVILRLITSKWNHQLILPIYFLIIPIVFYIVVAAAQLDLSELRTAGWVFDIGADPAQKSSKWYSLYSYLRFNHIDAPALFATIPTQLALLFFNILHPPLNIPALSVSLNEDVDTNKELVAHGYSNFIAGLVGSVPNYLVFINSVLFYRVGGGTRIAGLLLAAATFVLLAIGTGPIAFIPVMEVGALIFVLGIDLVKEALWETRHRVSRIEYLTIISIMVCMTAWDFVIGVLFGIVMSCFFFVVQNSQRRSIRAFHTGETVMSTVRRPSSQRDYIREVSKQTTIIRLQGFLFFGTITYVEETIRDTIEGPSWSRNPVRFMLVDLTLVGGVDMSAAEAFVRIHRVLSARGVTLVFCGFSADGPIGLALASVEVLGASGVELFSTFNDALEWTENAYLRTWFRSQKNETVGPVSLPGRQDADIQAQPMLDSYVGSPRLSHLHRAGKRTMTKDLQLPAPGTGLDVEPYNTIIKAFAGFGDVQIEQLQPISSYLERVVVPENHILWNQGDAPDAMYLIESGILRASYYFAEYTQSIDESMVPGTLAGELSALSGLPRNATAVAERQSVLWKLSTQNLERLQVEKPEIGRLFVGLVVKAAKVDYDILLSALAIRQ
ncbi:sulfate transporter family-domain-containing protein [Flagelloscypha sp. PMI_526]|nr:sulfate transporter family-domain-containing protein [Flagelloscypha sp. PMI_526]